MAPDRQHLISASWVGAPSESQASPNEVARYLQRLWRLPVDSLRHLKRYHLTDALPRWPSSSEASQGEAIERDGKRGIFYAGDYTRHPSLQGAMESGERAAEAILKWLAIGS
jgi:predicted NAD/FAD-dependent oxidoreductase